MMEGDGALTLGVYRDSLAEARQHSEAHVVVLKQFPSRRRTSMTILKRT
jgi:hypothetical protein